METILHHFKHFYFVLLLIVFSGNVNGQTYTITGNVNSSSLACATFIGYNVISIGNGSTASSLIIDENLNLTGCSLGPIQLVVNNATLDFTTANKQLRLPAGSSILFMNGGTLNPDGSVNGGGCTGNDRIYIGGVLLATCNGQAGLIGFDDLIVLGGTGSATSNSPICSGNTLNLSATPPPVGGPYTYSWSGPGLSATPYSIDPNYSPTAPVSGSYQVVMKSSIIDTRPDPDVPFIMIAETAVVVNPAGSTITPTASATSQPTCTEATGTITVTAPIESGMRYSINGLNYTNTTGIFTSVAPGTYSVTAKNSSGCISNSVSVTINVQPATPTTPTITSYTLPTFANNDGTITLGNLPAGAWLLRQIKDGATVTDIIGSGTPYTVTGLSMGSYEFKVVGLCISLSPTPTQIDYTPDVSAATAVNCTGFTANWPATPTATSYLLDVSTVSNFATFVTGYHDLNVGPVLTFPVTGMSGGTLYYRIRAKNATQTSLYSATITVTPITNTWGLSGWSTGSPPTIDQSIVFNADFTSTADVEGCSCTVTNGAVDFDLAHTLKITNWVHVNGGSLTFSNNASLVQINNVPNTGNIVYNRRTPSLIETDYTYWSSPVAGQSLNISPDYTNGTFYSYDFAADNWAAASLSTTMVAGNGYIIRGQKPDNTSYNITGTFTGVPNNGDLSISVGTAKGTAILLGNPYPSALDANVFLTANTGVIEGTLYFWTHKTAIQLASDIINGTAGSGIYAYTSDDYASYNAVGGASASPSGSDIPSGKIGAGQGFFGTIINSTVVGPIVYNNSMRLSSGGLILDNSQFFKTKNSKEKTANAIERHRVWLNLSNTQGAFKQTLIGYVTDATNSIDSRFDGESFDGNQFVDFYSVNQNKNLVIQGRALPFDENDEVVLGYRSTIEGAFTISIGQVDGLFVSQTIYLEDKLTNTVFDLKSGNYTFNTTKGTFNDRFVLRYKNNTINKTLATNDVETIVNNVLVSVKEQIKINSFTEMIDQVLIYDVLGKLIYKKTKLNCNEFVATDLVLGHQPLVVKTSLQNGTIVTDKIIF